MADEPKEHLLDKIGSFGPYQLRLFGILSYALSFVTMGFVVMTFSTAEPPWRCTANSTSCTLNGTFKPGDAHYEYRCSIPREDWEFAVEGDFDSIVTEWDLVCERGVQASLANSLTFLPGIIVAVTASIVSDKYGRKKIVFLTNFILYISGLLSAFAQSYWVFAVFRALAGLGFSGTIISSYTLVIEYVGVSHRSSVGQAYWAAWNLGMCLLALLGYLLQSWRVLTIIVSAPGMLMAIFWWWTPESLRWLLVKGKIDEAKKILQIAARVNKKIITEEDMSQLRTDEERERMGDIRDLFASRSMAHLTMFSWYGWFVNAIGYTGILLSAATVGGNMYLNIFLQAVCECIAIAAAIPVLNRIGRKKTIVFGLWFAGTFMFTAALLSYFDDGSTGFLAGKILSSMVLGKFFITVAFNSLYIHSSELFPTVIRNTAMGIFSTGASVGSVCASYTVYSQRVHPLMPFGIMAANTLVCGIMFTTLPETNKKAMPDTLKQVDKVLQYSSDDVHEDQGIQMT